MARGILTKKTKEGRFEKHTDTETKKCYYKNKRRAINKQSISPTNRNGVLKKK